MKDVTPRDDAARPGAPTRWRVGPAVGLVLWWMLAGGGALQPAWAQAEGWKAGVARVEITPEEPLWMAGYGARDRPAEGTLHPLWAKALALEDAAGHRAVFVTSDLLGLPQGVSNQIRDRVAAEHGLARDQVMLTSSHAHSGPVLEDALYDIYPLDDARRAQIERYSRRLENEVVELIGAALADLAPARLASGTGVVRFAVNRRNNDPSAITTVTELAGPSDHAVPVLRVTDADGAVQALVFGYACHATATPPGVYLWAGDYPGFAQIALEAAYPGATALFFAGAGADQDPIPRGRLTWAEQYGQELAAAVGRVLQEPMRPLAPRLATRYSEITLALTEAPDRAALRRAAEAETGSHRRWALRMGAALDAGEVLRKDYPYPVQLWRLGDQTLVALGGEVVVDYAIELKRLFGQELFVVAYANDVMSYIPSARVLREGGYEGKRAQRVYGLPSTWAADLEVRILAEVLRLAREADVGLPPSPLEEAAR